MPNWSQVLEEIRQESATRTAEANRQTALATAAVDTIRRKYMAALHQHTQRNIIAYYSGFLSKPEIRWSEITDEDKNGFMMAIHKLDRKKGLDLILHTQGGNIAATESIVDYLHKMFGTDIRAIVPQIAMSAGTMIACSCKTIFMAKHSSLGPIDPHIGSLPAYGVLLEFKEACREVKKDPQKIPMWQSIIGQYPPAFLGRCRNAISWSNSFVRDQLEHVMFASDPVPGNAKKRAERAVRKLSSFSGNKSHERHINREEARETGLDIQDIEAPDETLQDLILTVHHCFMHSLMNTPSFKIIENHLGVALAKGIRQT
jgi:hypothetical protein